jgi:CheY-like chemotaxis protein
MLLTQEGYEVVLAESGAKCLALCASSPPDLLLLDYVLPDMRGVEVCQNLINSPSTWEIPVLLMSGNGNAIRQLYQDMNNVADYLTKPFPPNVLNAVVTHVLKKSRQGDGPGQTSSQTGLSLPAGGSSQLPPRPSTPETSRPASSQTGSAPGGPGVGSALVAARRQAPEEVVAKFRKVLQKHWRAVWQRVPDWEQKRGEEAPGTFYQNRFLAETIWKDLGSDLLSAAGWTTSFSGAFRCSTALVHFDTILQHLHGAKATGELRVELAEETISVFFSNGEVAFLGSNNPRQYCAGSTFGFHTLPHGLIAQAVQAQEMHSVPFFISLHQNGGLNEAPLLRKLLREQGERAVLRAYQASAAICDFRPLDQLPGLVERYRRPFPVWHLLLVCYRKVDDWFTIEQSLPGFSAGLSPSLEFQSRVRQLHLNDQERQLLQAITPSRSVQEIVDSSSLGPYLASQVLFRFIQLGLFFSVPRPEETNLVDPSDEPREPAPNDQAQLVEDPSAEQGVVVPLQDPPPTQPEPPPELSGEDSIEQGPTTSPGSDPSQEIPAETAREEGNAEPEPLVSIQEAFDTAQTQKSLEDQTPEPETKEDPGPGKSVGKRKCKESTKSKESESTVESVKKKVA